MRAEVGVIGGVGPMATAYYLERVIDMTQGETDQDHIPMMIFHHTTIPDRTSFILGHSDQDPLPDLIDDAKALEALGCGFITIPCNTAFYFYQALEEAVAIPVVNIVAETVAYAKSQGVRSLGLLATDGTLATQTYQQAAQAQGLRVCLPQAEDQAHVMAMIYDGVKAGKPVRRQEVVRVLEGLRAQGADGIVLGCTELSVLKRDVKIQDRDVLDSIDVLARETVLRTGRALSPAGDLMEVTHDPSV